MLGLVRVSARGSARGRGQGNLCAMLDELGDHAAQDGIRAARIGSVPLEARHGGDAAHLVRVRVRVGVRVRVRFRVRVRVRVGVRVRVRVRLRARVRGDAAHQCDKL